MTTIRREVVEAAGLLDEPDWHADPHRAASRTPFLPDSWLNPDNTHRGHQPHDPNRHHPPAP